MEFPKDMTNLNNNITDFDRFHGGFENKNLMKDSESLFYWHIIYSFRYSLTIQ